MFNNYFQPNMLPAQQVLQANGKASIDAIRLAPNSSVFVMDTTAPIVWLCISDSLGNVSATPYDIKQHTEPVPAENQGLEDRLRSLEETVNKLVEGMSNAKSNVTAVKPKQTSKSDEAN